MSGVLALVGGAEFQPGNETQDRILIEGARALGKGRPAFVIATAAARHSPERAVDTARGWFAGLGWSVSELPLVRRTQASDLGILAEARTGAFFYLCGGDPGIVPQVLAATPAWDAIVGAWHAGASLAGSSAGAMALGEWTLIRSRMPGDANRTPRAALGTVPGMAVLPHFETFGHRWIESARAELAGRNATLVGIHERAAAIWQDGRWRASEAGKVTLIHADGAARVAAGGSESLPIPAPTGVGSPAGRSAVDAGPTNSDNLGQD